jgi:Uma2 family endonuclease
MTAAAAKKLMTVAEFLEWEPDDDHRYDLIDGVPIAHAAPTPEHGSVGFNFGVAIDAQIRAKKLPCRVEVATGVQPVRRARWNHFVPDVVVRCGTSRQRPSTPVVVIEIASPSNRQRDVLRKVAGYKSTPSILAIIQAEQDEHLCQIQQRIGEKWVTEDISGPDAVVRIEAPGIEFRLGDVYQDIEVAEQPPEQSGGAAE